MGEQVAEMKTQAGHMAEQTGVLRGSVEAAQKSANAALAQIQAMKDRERARLVLRPKPLTEIEDNRHRLVAPRLEFEIENFGYSHAFDVAVEGRCEITTDSVAPPKGNVASYSVVGIVRTGEQVGRGSLAIVATDEMWENTIRPGASSLYAHLWGVLRYRDVFGDWHSPSFQYSNWIQGLGDLTQRYGSMVIPVMSMFGWEDESEPEEKPGEDKAN
jgi:hypothetical protein